MRILGDDPPELRLASVGDFWPLSGFRSSTGHEPAASASRDEVVAKVRGYEPPKHRRKNRATYAESSFWRVVEILALVACSTTPDEVDAGVQDSAETCSWTPDELVRPDASLPTARTEEPCNGVDDDGDGITDPHCPTVLCDHDSDCTFGGLVPDADCNSYQVHRGGGFDKPGCNQIDGIGDKAIECRGVLCPEGLKCVEGDCIVPGNGAPMSECKSGRDCPIHAGCIPQTTDPEDFEERRDYACIWFCHTVPCPAGFICATSTVTENGSATTHRTCVPPDYLETHPPGPDTVIGPLCE